MAVERIDHKAKGELTRVVAILAAEHTMRGAHVTSWWLDTLTQARQHSVKVSEELRGAIKASIEIIGNDVLQRRAQQDVHTDIDGNELDNQALRYLYRILFLFSPSPPRSCKSCPPGTMTMTKVMDFPACGTSSLLSLPRTALKTARTSMRACSCFSTA